MMNAQLIKQTQSNETALFYLHCVTTFSVSRYATDGFAPITTDEDTGEKLLTLYVKDIPEDPCLAVLHPVCHCVPLGSLSPIGEGDLLTVVLKDEHDVQLCTTLVDGGGPLTQQTANNATRPFGQPTDPYAINGHS